MAKTITKTPTTPDHSPARKLLQVHGFSLDDYNVFLLEKQVISRRVPIITNSLFVAAMLKLWINSDTLDRDAALNDALRDRFQIREGQ